MVRATGCEWTHALDGVVFGGNHAGILHRVNARRGLDRLESLGQDRACNVLPHLRVHVELIGHVRNNMQVNLSHAWL